MKRFEYGNLKSNNVLIQMVDDHDLSLIENEVNLIKEKVGDDFYLIAFKINNWNNDLSPWNAAPVFGSEAFGQGANETLAKVLSELNDTNKKYYIGGYSLAGLFALWAAFNTDKFEGVASASPSIWFPGFIDYMKDNLIRTSKVYLSLGDKEEKTRNPLMAKVGDCIREAYTILKEKNVDCVLKWNEGNHFKDADIRTASGFAWILKRKSW